MVRKITPIEQDMSGCTLVGCLVFGYGNEGLKVLLKKKAGLNMGWELPSEHFRMDECAETTARRIVARCVGTGSIHTEQFRSFTINHARGRSIWVGHVALVNMDAVYVYSGDMEWFEPTHLPNVALSEREIIGYASSWLKEQIKSLHMGYRFLPEQFTMLQLMNLFETVLQCKLDRANFNKKIKSLTYIKRLNDRVYVNSNRPSYVYTVDVAAFQQVSRWFDTHEQPRKSIL